MILKELEVSGFKSFANASLLTFSSRVTAIVGPNGSGKSNIAEAFRFVLGEQSIKSLRGSKTEDLIFNGGNHNHQANRARAKIVFDNSSRMFDLDLDEIVIERIIFRDGASEYKLNGSSCRLKDITQLLASASIGASGHHIISQGEADKLLNCNALERKDMLEDALGLKAYIYRKRESEQKLERTRANMDQTVSLRRELAPHLTYLRKQADKVREAEEMRQELTGLYTTYLAQERFLLDTDTVRVKKLLSELSGKHKEYEERKPAAEESAHIQELNKARGEVSTVEQELSANYTESGGLQNKIGVLEGRIAEIEHMTKEAQTTSKISLPSVLGFLDEWSLLATNIIKTGNSMDALNLVKGLLDRIKNRRFESQSSTVAEPVDSAVEQRIKALRDEQRGYQDKLQALIHARKEIETRLNKAKQVQQEVEQKINEHKIKQVTFQSEFQNIIRQLHEVREEEGLLQDREDRFVEDLQEASVLIGTESLKYKHKLEQLQSVNTAGHADLYKRVERLKIKLEGTDGAFGGDVLKEFSETAERDEFLKKELSDLQESMKTVEGVIGELDAKIAEEFVSGLAQINQKFQEFFEAMFGGGHAELKQVSIAKRTKEEDEEPEVEVGIDVGLSLPRKRVKSLAMLSGGERTLVSIALLFAMSQIKPPPFIILDETDAALDEANSRKYGDMIEELSRHSQLVLITHNRETMSRAGLIYGVTMGQEGVSKLLSVSFDDAAKVAK